MYVYLFKYDFHKYTAYETEVMDSHFLFYNILYFLKYGS